MLTPGDPALPEARALALVPGLEGGAAPTRIERLAGGTVNDTWRIDSALGRFVLRIDGPAWRRPGVDRERERLLHDVAADGGLAPRVLRRERTAGAQVSEFLDGRSWRDTDLAQPASLERLAARLSELHALVPPTAVAPFDPAAVARDYLQQLDPGVRARSGATGVAERTAAAAGRVGTGERGLAIVHGDLVPANLLDGTQLRLLDWEYAQLADPLYDLGCLIAYHPDLQHRSRWLLDAAGFGSAGTPVQLAAAIEVYENLSRLWWLARGELPHVPTGIRGGRSAN